MKKTIILLLVSSFLLSVLLIADEIETKLSSALSSYKNGKTEATLNALSDVFMIVHNKKEFKIKEMVLCSSISGFGDYKKRESVTLKKDEPFILYIEVDGYGVEKKEGKYWFWLSKDVKLTDSTGKVIFQQNDFRNFKRSYTFPVFPFFMDSLIKNVPPGKYKFEVTIKDHIKKSFITGAVDFIIEDAARTLSPTNK